MISRECFINLSKDRQLYEISKSLNERTGKQYSETVNCFTDQTIDNQSYDMLYFCSDTDAVSYAQSVEIEDGQPLEIGVKKAYCNLFKSLKHEGIWNLIDECCMMCGARTIEGCLVPIKGQSPMVVGENWPSSDYDRKNGLLSDGTRYLDIGAINTRHLSVYVSSFSRPSGDIDNKTYIGFNNNIGASSFISRRLSDTELKISGISYISPASSIPDLGFIGGTRVSPSQIVTRINGSSFIKFGAPFAVQPISSYVFALNSIPFNSSSIANARIAFYSAGKSITQQQLESLDLIVNNFMSEINISIP